MEHQVSRLDTTRPPECHAVDLMIGTDDADVAATVWLPHRPIGLVVFVHGSGSARHSSHNRGVAGVLCRHRIGCLSVDLVRPDEIAERGVALNMPLLTQRMTGVRRSLRGRPDLRELPVGFLGAGSEAPVALWAATEDDADIRAVVVHGARPDLAAVRLNRLDAPTLFLVGGHDRRVITSNVQAADLVRGPHQVLHIPDAEGASAKPLVSQWIADRAAKWFAYYLPLRRAASAPLEWQRPLQTG